MVGQKNFIKMKAKPIPKELIDNIELRVEDIQIPATASYGFEGYLLKNVLVPYINGKRVGYFKFIISKNKKQNYYNVRYFIAKTKYNSREICFNRVAYIIMNKDDPRVIEVDNHYHIVDDLKVDHDKDIKLQDAKFLIKADTKKNLQLLTNRENIIKGKKKITNLPNYITFNLNYNRWMYRDAKLQRGFSILRYGYVGAYLKAIDVYKKRTGDHYIANLNDIDNNLPPDYKTMTEREFYNKYCKKYVYNANANARRKKQINPDDELDLGLSLA